MKCEQTGERLIALLGGELDDAQAERTRAHVAQCAECALRLMEYEAARQAAHAWNAGNAASSSADEEKAKNEETGRFWAGIQQQMQLEEAAEMRQELKQMRDAISALRAEVTALREQISRQNRGKGKSPNVLLSAGTPSSLSSNLRSLL